MRRLHYGLTSAANAENDSAWKANSIAADFCLLCAMRGYLWSGLSELTRQVWTWRIPADLNAVLLIRNSLSTFITDASAVLSDAGTYVTTSHIQHLATRLIWVSQLLLGGQHLNDLIPNIRVQMDLHEIYFWNYLVNVGLKLLQEPSLIISPHFFSKNSH